MSIESVLTTVFVAVLSALLAARLALMRFRSEKWWERKLVAYTAIIESLHHLKEDFGNDIDAEMGLRQRPPKHSDEEKASIVRFRNARAELSKLADMGEFLISTQATAALQALERELNKSHDQYFDHLESGYVAVRDCLTTIKPLARDDLESSWWRSLRQQAASILARVRPS